MVSLAFTILNPLFVGEVVTHFRSMFGPSLQATALLDEANHLCGLRKFDGITAQPVLHVRPKVHATLKPCILRGWVGLSWMGPMGHEKNDGPWENRDTTDINWTSQLETSMGCNTRRIKCGWGVLPRGSLWADGFTIFYQLSCKGVLSSNLADLFWSRSYFMIFAILWSWNITSDGVLIVHSPTQKVILVYLGEGNGTKPVLRHLEWIPSFLHHLLS